MRHVDIWSGLDKLAARHNLSSSGLAKLAGLDATAFNKSKRAAKDGRPRWPSTESISRALQAVGASFDEFAALVEGNTSARMTAPLIGMAQAGSDGFFDDAGFPCDTGWEEVEFPGASRAEGAYALEISGNSMEPAYREGDRIVVSPTEEVRRGDRVVVKTRKGEVMAKVLNQRSDTAVELLSLNPEHPPRVLNPADIAWIARILWVSQ
ncbi:MAG: helix-turn-helix transcriptional regulator [Henriciella sp.]|nr:helix-turn-helix transcriptional regulator [Henriciella sp.]